MSSSSSLEYQLCHNDFEGDASTYRACSGGDDGCCGGGSGLKALVIIPCHILTSFTVGNKLVVVELGMGEVVVVY